VLGVVLHRLLEALELATFGPFGGGTTGCYCCKKCERGGTKDAAQATGIKGNGGERTDHDGP
jgi:hypothetical protein